MDQHQQDPQAPITQPFTRHIPEQPDQPTLEQPVTPWHVVTQQPPMPRLSAPGTWPIWAKLAIPAAALIMILCGVCGSCGFLLGQSSPGSSTTAQQQQQQAAAPTVAQRQGFPVIPVATTTRTALPSSTPDGRIAAYRSFVGQQADILGADFTDVGDTCGGSSISACRDTLQIAHEDILTFLNGLKQHPAPSCLSAADKILRDALSLYSKGTQLAMDGIDQYNVEKIHTAGDVIKQGNDRMEQATAAVTAAVC